MRAFIASLLLTSACFAQQSLTPQQVADLTKNLPPGTTVEYIITDENAKGSGASLQASGDKIVTEFDASSPESTLGKGRAGASGGSLFAGVEAERFESAFGNPLLWVGILCVLAAGYFAYRRLGSAAIAAGVVGGTFIAIALFPGIIIVAIAAAGVLAVGSAFYANNNSLKFKEALRATVAGIAELSDQDDGVYRDIKYRVDKHAEPGDVEVIKKIKREDDL